MINKKNVLSVGKRRLCLAFSCLVVTDALIDKQVLLGRAAQWQNWRCAARWLVTVTRHQQEVAGRDIMGGVTGAMWTAAPRNTAAAAEEEESRAARAGPAAVPRAPAGESERSGVAALGRST